jgi:hypothetical protein
MDKKFGSITFYTRRPVDRRQFKDRRFFPRHEDLDHKPERRVNMIDRRILGDRRGLVSDIINTLWESSLIIQQADTKRIADCKNNAYVSMRQS